MASQCSGVTSQTVYPRRESNHLICGFAVNAPFTSDATVSSSSKNDDEMLDAMNSAPTTGNERIVRIDPQVGHHRGVEVAGQHDQVVGAGADCVEHHTTFSVVAVPRVDHHHRWVGADHGVAAEHEDLLRDHVPDRGRGRHPVEQPLTLGGTEHRLLGRRRQHVVTHLHHITEGLHERRLALLVGPVLTGVEHVEAHEVAVCERAVDVEVGPGRWVEAHRHVLVPDLVSGRPAGQECVGCDVEIAARSRVVVVHLVVVPRDDPRHQRVGGLQQRVGLVDRVPLAVLLDRLALEGLAGRARPRVRGATSGILVDVVAEEHERVEVALLHEVAVGGVVAVLPVLAGGEREAEPLGCRAGRGERAGARRRRRETSDAEPVVVLGVGLESGDVDVHRVAERGHGGGRSGGDDVGELGVGRHLPLDVDVDVGKRIGGEQAGPQHHGVGERVAGRHAERERIGRDDRDGRGRRGAGRCRS